MWMDVMDWVELNWIGLSEWRHRVAFAACVWLRNFFLAILLHLFYIIFELLLQLLVLVLVHAAAAICTMKNQTRSLFTVMMVVVMMVVVFLVFVHLESLLWVSLIMKDHHFAMWIFVRVPALNMALFVGNFVPLLRVFMVSRCVAELVAVRSMNTLSIGQGSK